MEIVSISEYSSSLYITELRDLLEGEWGDFASFETEEGNIRTPPPLIAIENETLVGGLVYSLWPNPETEHTTIWVNGLIVKPNWRRKGIASTLIQGAMNNKPLLFVLTEIPHLYSNIGWQTISKNSEGTVLKYQS